MVLVYFSRSTVAIPQDMLYNPTTWNYSCLPEAMICLMFVTPYRLGQNARDIKGPFRESTVEIKNIPKCLIWKHSESRNILTHLPAPSSL